MISDFSNQLDGMALPSTNDARASTRAAARAAVSWNNRSITLVPLLGRRGMTAIYVRVLESVETEHPWLRDVRNQTLGTDPFAPLLAHLSLCNPSIGATVQNSLLTEFDREITVRLGEPSTQRLLTKSKARGAGANAGPSPGAAESAGRPTPAALGAASDARRTSERDDLTGATTRTRVLARLKRAITVAAWSGTPTAVLVVDLDHCKRINAGTGQRVGDDMLCKVAARLHEALRKTDTVCRYAGDKFVVVLTPMECRLEAGSAAARMLRAIADLRATGPDGHALCTSIGMSLHPDHGSNPDALLSRAERSMYRHKRGRPD